MAAKATFVVLLRWTKKGIEHVKDSPSRYEDFKKSVGAADGDVLSFHMTLGAFDLVTVIEVPDDETGARITLAVRSLGNVQVETLRAFKEEEYRKILDSLPS
jgi:uncharacterized protein with GYD domain